MSKSTVGETTGRLMHKSHKSRLYFLALAIIVLLNYIVNTDSYSGAPLNTNILVEVLYVVDGDSIVVIRDNLKIKVRLWGIDAPEYDQPHAKKSKKYLKKSIEKQRITLEPKYYDKYGRLVAVAYKGKKNINQELVKNGQAWVHVYYCLEKPCSFWFDLEKMARKNRLGLWSYENPLEPWVWKRKK